MTLPRPTFADFRTKRREAMDAAFFDRRFKLLVDILMLYADELERQGRSSDELVELGLTRINEILTPALVRVQLASELGFLIGISTTSLALVEGGSSVFVINEDTRGLFTPTPFLSVTRSGIGAEAQYAIAQLVAWNAETGGLELDIITIEGISGAHNDWVISASSGIPASIAAKTAQVDADATQVALDRIAVEAALLLVSNSVTSVAGKTGNVALVIGDIANLVTTLSGKSNTGHTHAASDIASGVIPIARLATGTPSGAKYIRDDGTLAEPPGSGGTWGNIVGTLADQTDLQASLNAKSNTGHTHAQSEVTNLVSDLAGKSNTGHTHTTANVTGLDAALTGKQAASAYLDAFSAKAAPAGTVLGTTDTQTLTNKRVTPRVNSVASGSPYSWNSDNSDRFLITAQAASLTMPADTGTPTDGQTAVFRIFDNGTQRSITWITGQNKSFRAVGVTLPANTTINKTLYIGCMYNSAALRWDVISVNQQA